MKPSTFIIITCYIVILLSCGLAYSFALLEYPDKFLIDSNPFTPIIQMTIAMYLATLWLEIIVIALSGIALGTLIWEACDKAKKEIK